MPDRRLPGAGAGNQGLAGSPPRPPAGRKLGPFIPGCRNNPGDPPMGPRRGPIQSGPAQRETGPRLLVAGPGELEPADWVQVRDPASPPCRSHRAGRLQRQAGQLQRSAEETGETVK